VCELVQLTLPSQSAGVVEVEESKKKRVRHQRRKMAHENEGVREDVGRLGSRTEGPVGSVFNMPAPQARRESAKMATSDCSMRRAWSDFPHCCADRNFATKMLPCFGTSVRYVTAPRSCLMPAAKPGGASSRHAAQPWSRKR
jgi:hypothetical protein